MSAFSRGLGLAMNQRIFSFVPRIIPVASPGSGLTQRSADSFSQMMRNSPILQAARNLQTSARLRAPKPSKAKPTAAKAKPAYVKFTPPPNSRPNLPSPSSARWNANASRAAAARLAKSGQPTLLYESPSHFWFHFFSLVTATFCTTYAAMHYYWYVYNKPEGVHWLVPVGWAMVCLATLCIGAYSVNGTKKIVRRITAVPKHVLPKEYLEIGKGKQSPQMEHTVALLRQSPIAIEITLSQLSSRFSTKKVFAAPSEIWLGIRMQDLVTQQEVAKKAEQGVLRAPDPIRDTFLDKASDAINDAWKGARRSFAKGGFVPMKINGDRYRLDVSKGAQVMEGGKLVDVLLPCYPDRFDDGLWPKFTGT